MLKLLVFILFVESCLCDSYYYNKNTNKTLTVKEGDPAPTGDHFILVKSPNDANPIELEECPEDKFTCENGPPSYNNSIRYLCQASTQCPPKYVCCTHKCFLNPVCAKAPKDRSTDDYADDEEDDDDKDSKTVNNRRKKIKLNKGYKKRSATTASPKTESKSMGTPR